MESEPGENYLRAQAQNLKRYLANLLLRPLRCVNRSLSSWHENAFGGHVLLFARYRHFRYSCFAMRKSIFVLALLAAPSLASALFVQAPTLAIQVDRPIAKVGPTLYGLMTEEIDFSYDV